MNSGETKPGIIDKELIRQRDIASQLAALHTPAPHIRAAAARRLGDLRAGVDELLTCLRDPMESVRAAAAMALGNFTGDDHYEEIVDTLMAAIDDSSEKVCQSAIRSLGLLRAEVAREEIVDFLGDPNPYILGAAIVALARLSTEDAAQQLAEFLDHPNSFVRTQAVRAVGLMKYTQASQKINALLEQARAERLAGSLEDLTSVSSRLEGEQYSVLSQLIRTSGELKIRQAAPILMEIAQKEVGFRGLAVEALIAIGDQIDPGLLTGLLSDPSVYLRKRLIRLVCQYHYTPALPMLRPLLHEDNVALREASLQAVAQLKDMASLPHILWMCYHDSNPFLRMQALQILFQLRGCGAEVDLAALAQDVNFQIRRAAATYLFECRPLNRPSIQTLRRFAIDFPEDPLSPAIMAFLSESGNLNEPQDSPAGTGRVLIPDSLRDRMPFLLEALDDWQEVLSQSSEAKSRALAAAVALLLSELKEDDHLPGDHQ